MIRHFNTSRAKRKARIRAKIRGTAARPRLTVYRSNRNLFVQLIDDEKGITVVGMADRQLANQKNKIVRARELGKLLAEAAKKKHITQVVFDRSGYTYHGRVKEIAEGAREGGLQF